MKQYLNKNILPFAIQAAFIVSCLLLPREYYIYSNFLFYTLLFSVFFLKGEFSFREWRENLKPGKKFWIQTAITGLLFLTAFITTNVLENMFPNLSTGMISLQSNTPGKLALFAVSTMFYPAITEEVFYRKGLISFYNKTTLVITTLLGMFLYALEHALSIWGIVLAMIWALPLSLSYIRTKNIYVPMTAHFIGNLIGNGIDVIFMLIALT